LTSAVPSSDKDNDRTAVAGTALRQALHPLDTARWQPAVVDAPAVIGLMVEGHRGPLAELSRDLIGARHVTS